MKITKSVYHEGVCKVIFDGYPNSVFCVDLDDKTTVNGVKGELELRLKAKVKKDKKQIFDDLKLGDLVGVEVNAGN